MPPPSRALLPDDLIDEILLRFPPEEPELLVRAALVCKRWFRLIADPCGVLMTMADGALGFAAVLKSKLDVWSMVSSTEGEGCARWAQRHTIDLEAIEPLPASLNAICCMDGVAAILKGMKGYQTIFVVNLKSRQTRKIHLPEGRAAYSIIPFMSFYTPALRAARNSCHNGKLSINERNMSNWSWSC